MQALVSVLEVARGTFPAQSLVHSHPTFGQSSDFWPVQSGPVTYQGGRQRRVTMAGRKAGQAACAVAGRLGKRAVPRRSLTSITPAHKDCAVLTAPSLDDTAAQLSLSPDLGGPGIANAGRHRQGTCACADASKIPYWPTSAPSEPDWCLLPGCRCDLPDLGS